MKLKHSKYRNTGLIYELLVRQIAADTLSRKTSPALKILKKYYAGKTPLAREYTLYEFVTSPKNRNLSQSKAESIVTSISEVSKKINYKSLGKVKYGLIRDIKEEYDLEEFFSIKVENYRALAALYCILEAHNNEELFDPRTIVDNKVTLLEHLTSSEQDTEGVTDATIEEFRKMDKDVKLLTYKILLEKFNNKYRALLPEQKALLKEFICSVSSKPRLRNFVNEQLLHLKEQIDAAFKNVRDDDIVRIKLEEIAKVIKPVEKTEKITDNTVISLLQYYELIQELKNLKIIDEEKSDS